METKADGSDGSLVLIKQGAEAEVYYQGTVFKEIQASDFGLKATLKRLNAEARCMTKARRLGVLTPVLYAVDPVMHSLTFEYIEGPSVKDILLVFGLVGVDKEQMADIATQIGNAIGKLHDGGLVHGDLTTSNMLLRSASNQLVLIDFGLSFTSTLPEDKAFDLYVLERALLSMHSSCGNVMDHILAAYRKSSKQWSSTLNKLAEVRLRQKAHNGWLTSPSLQTPREQIRCHGARETERPAHCKDLSVFVAVLIIVSVTDGTYLNLCVYNSLYSYSTI
ncbi:hypothetical protein P3S68_012432 [Capsicum galapagoense]